MEPLLAGHLYFIAKFLRQVDSKKLKASTTVIHRRRRQLTFGFLSVLASLVEDEEDGGDDDDDEHSDDAADDSSDAARYERNKERNSASRYGSWPLTRRIDRFYANIFVF